MSQPNTLVAELRRELGEIQYFEGDTSSHAWLEILDRIEAAQTALLARIAEVEAGIQEIERRPGRRTVADRIEIGERSRYLGGLLDAYTIVSGKEHQS